MHESLVEGIKEGGFPFVLRERHDDIYIDSPYEDKRNMSGPPTSEYAGYIDPNFPSPGGPNDASVIIYGYRPSLALGVLGVVLFGLAFFGHAYRLFQYRTWYFSPVMLGTAMEVVGYAFRLLSSQVNPYSVINFVVQYFFIVIAPIFFSAAIYTVLTIFINRTKREYAPLPPKVILWVFITCDIVATITQVAGAALIGVAASNRKDPTTPNNILLAGLAFQVFSFFVFCVCLGISLYRARKVVLSSLKAFTAALCIATLLVYLRTCFRLAETASGLNSDLATQEAYFGALEFAPIVIAVSILAVWHPGKWLPQNRVWNVSV